MLKSNLVEGKGNISFKFNLKDLALNLKKGHRNDISRFDSRFGLYPGRALVLFAEHSHWIFMNSNTIPFYKFFPKLENCFPSPSFNFIQGDDNPLSKLK